MMDITITAPVERTVSFQAGHEIRLSSKLMSLKNCVIKSINSPNLFMIVSFSGQEGIEPPTAGFGVQCSA